LHHSIFAITCQTKLYFDNFWHTYTTVQFLPKAYFTFFIKRKQRSSLRFKTAHQ